MWLQGNRVKNFSTSTFSRVKATGYEGVVVWPIFSLNRPYDPAMTPITLHFIHYYAFANRGPSEMIVWIQGRQEMPPAHRPLP